MDQKNWSQGSLLIGEHWPLKPRLTADRRCPDPDCVAALGLPLGAVRAERRWVRRWPAWSSRTTPAAGSTTVSLTANGLGSSFTLTPSPVAFATVNRNSTKSLTVSVKNVGTILGQVSAASIAGANAAAFTVTGAGCLGTSLAATAAAT
jgi:hypothetical protein